MIIGSKNKGDWSEFYVLLYLLGSRELYAADEHLDRIPEFKFPINKIMRKESAAEKIDFILEGIDSVEIYFNDVLQRTMTSADFTAEAAFLVHDIPLGSGSFDIPHAETFLNNIYCKRLAAPSADITDIKMELHDSITGINQVMGFSIKSYLGGAPSLLNASGATNLIYKVTGIDHTTMVAINSISTRTKIRDRIAAIYNHGGSITYYKTSNTIFSDNMMMIDSRMEEIIAELLLYSYSENVLDCRDIIAHLEETNPLNYPRAGMYVYKFKKFLCSKALGMDPSVEWNGIDEANGGYIVAKSNGEVLAYHLYNRDKFEQYLFDNTKLERGSTDRHGYASLYIDDDEMYINLNLQIRFKDN